MSEYVFLSTYQDRPARVRMGWSRSSQRYYLLVERMESAKTPIYDWEKDPDVSRYTDLTYFVKKLIRLGLTVPKAAVRGLAIAPWRDDGFKTTTTGCATRSLSVSARAAP